MINKTPLAIEPETLYSNQFDLWKLYRAFSLFVKNEQWHRCQRQLIKIRDMSEAHCKAEEGLMRIAGLSDLGSHRKFHTDLIKAMDERLSDCEGRYSSKCDTCELALNNLLNQELEHTYSYFQDCL